MHTYEPTPRTRHRSPLLLLLLCALLTACAPSPRQGGSTDDTADQSPATAVDPVSPVPLSLPPSVARAQFNRVEAALNAFDWMRASAALEAMDSAGLNADDRAYQLYLRARVAYLRGDQLAALALLDAAERDTAHRAILHRLNSFRHFMLSLGGDHLDAARIAFDLRGDLPAAEAAVWTRRGWLDLQRATPDRLEQALAAATEPQWIGWLHLALDARPEDEALRSRMLQWRSRYAEHPAAAPLPGGLDHALAADGRAQKIALLLPLSEQLGAAGKAVLDGYLAAYYAARAAGASGQTLLVFDLDLFPSATVAYDAALQQGAGMVVGPLSKSAVTALAAVPNRPLPVLALNRIDEPVAAGGAALVQLSLSPEDEAVTLAESAFGRGLRSALILSPGDSWGEKVERALRQRWETLGGHVVSGASYTARDEYSDSVKAALGLTRSAERARQIRDMLATNIEFTPRRRQDPDVIFLLSKNADEARSITPLLAFHYAGSLPVYALSGIYDGLPDDRNRDLNGVNFVEMPWLLGAAPELRVAIAAGDTGSDQYTRLNALGADAYMVQSRFQRLQSGPDALLRGNTGLLSLSPSLQIRREPSLAVFDGEVVRPQ